MLPSSSVVPPLLYTQMAKGQGSYLGPFNRAPVFFLNKRSFLISKSYPYGHTSIWTHWWLTVDIQTLRLPKHIDYSIPLETWSIQVVHLFYEVLIIIRAKWNCQGDGENLEEQNPQILWIQISVQTKSKILFQLFLGSCNNLSFSWFSLSSISLLFKMWTSIKIMVI